MIEFPTKNILLTGKPGVGKTTAMFKIIEQLTPGFAGGFWSREMRNRGKRVGFAIETLSGKRGVLSHVDLFSIYRVSQYKINIDDINSIIIPELRQARETGRLIIIDEIAIMELAAPEFYPELLKCLDTGRVLGTIQERPYPIIKEIKSRHDVNLIEITVSNRDEIPAIVLDLVRQQYGEY